MAGAHYADVHFHSSALDANMPVVMGMLGVLYVNCYNAETQAILPYDQVSSIYRIFNIDSPTGSYFFIVLLLKPLLISYS